MKKELPNNCPVCKEPLRNGRVCTKCNFDTSCDGEAYATLGKFSKRRKSVVQYQKERNPKPPKTIIAILVTLLTCIGIGIFGYFHFGNRETRLFSLKVSIGDYVTFGHFEQDNNLTNGKEPIEWQVLDVKDGKAFLLSRYGLATESYSDRGEDTWETCHLRSWLNDDFLNEAFNTKDLERIVETFLSADKNPKYNTNPGKPTNDKVFLLSIAEAEKYFSSDAARKCTPTASAFKGIDSFWWWLRSPGSSLGRPAGVGDDGTIIYGGLVPVYSMVVVRPAIWVELDSTN